MVIFLAMGRVMLASSPRVRRRWGRCVYDNICKFLQFQLTVRARAFFSTARPRAAGLRSTVCAVARLARARARERERERGARAGGR